VFDAAKNEEAWQAPHFLVDRASPYLVVGAHVLLTTSSGVTKIDAASGKKVWGTEPISSVIGLTLAAGSLWVIEPARLYHVNPEDGKTVKSYDIQQGASAVAVDGDHVLLSSFGYWIGRFNLAEKSWKWHFFTPEAARLHRPAQHPRRCQFSTSPTCRHCSRSSPSRRRCRRSAASLWGSGLTSAWGSE
jgi:outer membrane protein assembly factor BamB